MSLKSSAQMGASFASVYLGAAYDMSREYILPKLPLESTKGVKSAS
jgi:hypothetical protein